ncbi:MAG: hypothetical protein AAAC47_19190, partial [Pararhizobium sp.]
PDRAIGLLHPAKCHLLSDQLVFLLAVWVPSRAAASVPVPDGSRVFPARRVTRRDFATTNRYPLMRQNFAKPSHFNFCCIKNMLCQHV